MHVALIFAGVAALILRYGHEASRPHEPALIGVNLPSATFAAGALPGKEKLGYFYPVASDMDYFVHDGMNVVRKGFLSKRLQAALNGSVDSTEFQ